MSEVTNVVKEVWSESGLLSPLLGKCLFWVAGSEEQQVLFHKDCRKMLEVECGVYCEVYNIRENVQELKYFASFSLSKFSHQQLEERKKP